MLEKRKAALAAEGLFASAKKPLPYLPDVIGVVTSPSGAVIRDILHRLRDRFARHVLIWPVAVQGDKCAPEVAAAIAGFNALARGGPMPRPDLIIVARGGGSIEDLWGFNEEIVVRAAARRNPADIRSRPRNRHHPHRPRRRQARADPDSRRRTGGAGENGPFGLGRRSGRADGPGRMRGRKPAASACATWPARWGGRKRCWMPRANALTAQQPGWARHCAPPQHETCAIQCQRRPDAPDDPDPLPRAGAPGCWATAPPA